MVVIAAGVVRPGESEVAAASSVVSTAAAVGSGCSAVSDEHAVASTASIMIAARHRQFIHRDCRGRASAGAASRICRVDP
jgi:hypothetical protein